MAPPLDAGREHQLERTLQDHRLWPPVLELPEPAHQEQVQYPAAGQQAAKQQGVDQGSLSLQTRHCYPSSSSNWVARSEVATVQILMRCQHLLRPLLREHSSAGVNGCHNAVRNGPI